MIEIIKEFQMGPSSREAFVSDLSRDDAARFNMLMADMYGEDAYYDDLSKEEWDNLKRAFYGQPRFESKKSSGKKVTESFFREEFYDWYDSFSAEEQAEIEQYMEDEGMPDMVSDLSRTDMENIMSHFDDEHLDYLLSQEDEGDRINGGWQFDEGPYDEDEEYLDEGCKTEASRMDNEFYGGGTVYVGLYGDDCGPYGSLDEFKSALKKANIKILDESGDEEYGWDMTVKGIAKEIYKLVDGKIPGYDCDDVMDFIEQYSLDPDEFEDHEGDPTDYAWAGVDDDFDPNDEVYESVSKKTESRRYEIANYDPRFVYDWYMSLDDRWKNITTKYIKSFGGEDLNYYDNDDFYELIDIISELMAREEAGDKDLTAPVKLMDPDTGRTVKYSVPDDLFDEVVEEDNESCELTEGENSKVYVLMKEVKPDGIETDEESAVPLKILSNNIEVANRELDEIKNNPNRYPEYDGGELYIEEMDKDEAFIYFGDSEYESTVRKSNGKWTNKGKDGEHGEFKSKKAADAQRKAMFANGYKESVTEASARKPKFWNSLFAVNVIKDYKSGKLTKDNIKEWDREENDGRDPIPSFNTREIIDYYNGNPKAKKEMDSWISAKNEAYGDSLRDAPNPYDDEDEEYSDFNDGSVCEGDTFIEDGVEYAWVSPASDVYYLDFDAWQVWKATSVDSDEDAYFVVDKDTGFIDWGPCDSEMEAVEFLHSKVDDYNNEDDDLMDGLLDEGNSMAQEYAECQKVVDEFEGTMLLDYARDLIDEYDPDKDSLSNLLRDYAGSLCEEDEYESEDTEKVYDDLERVVNALIQMGAMRVS